jgi:hypothetical protein
MREDAGGSRYSAFCIVGQKPRLAMACDCDLA